MDPEFKEYLVQNFNLTSPIVLWEERDFGNVFKCTTAFKHNGNLCLMGFTSNDTLSVKGKIVGSSIPYMTITRFECDPSFDAVTARKLLEYSLRYISKYYLTTDVYRIVVRSQNEEQRVFLKSVGLSSELLDTDILYGALPMVLIKCDKLNRGMDAGKKSRNNHMKKRRSQNNRI